MSRTVHAYGYYYRIRHADKAEWNALGRKLKHAALPDKGEEPPDVMYCKAEPEPIPETREPEPGYVFRLRIKVDRKTNKLRFASCGG